MEFFFKINSFRNIIIVSNSLNPDLDRQNVSLDLGPNCLQSFEQAAKFATSRESFFISDGHQVHKELVTQSNWCQNQLPSRDSISCLFTKSLRYCVFMCSEIFAFINTFK